MYDSNESSQDSATAGTRWLLLIHQIPPKPDYLRVKVRRRLQRFGAAQLKNSVYVLPHAAETVEDFQWLRRLILADGGEATLCAASFIEGVSDAELETLFRAQSDAEYGEIRETARRAEAAPTDADVRRLRRHLAEAKARDFFGADAAASAAGGVHGVLGAVAAPRPDAADAPRQLAAAPDGVTWVTRTGVHIDRMASAWMIRRFIDGQARFKFVPAAGYRPAPGELRFDTFEGEFTHEGDRCTFEVLLERFVPDDPALRVIAEIVHDIDLKDEKFGRAEAAGVASAVRGIALAHAADAARVDAAAVLFDGLYAEFARRGA
jgi:hypothetical protein